MILYLIPARGGSKRLPGKNLRKLAGIPLVVRAVQRAWDAAEMVGGAWRVVVSTDSEEIAEVSREWGAEVLVRPPELATDEATSEDVVLHALSQYEGVEMLVLLQPTSPLATAEDVVRTMAAAKAAKGLAVTVCDGRRNGAVYASVRGDVSGPAVEVEMPASRSIDIDTAEDWEMAETLIGGVE